MWASPAARNFRSRLLMLHQAPLGLTILYGCFATGGLFPWIPVIALLVTSTACCFLASLVDLRATPRNFLCLVSSMTRITGWVMVPAVPGGVQSSLILGLGLEVVLAASVTPVVGISAILAAPGSLWLVKSLQDTSSHPAETIYQSALLVACGLASLSFTRRRPQIYEQSSRFCSLQCPHRVRLIERLEECSLLAAIGERVAWVAHGWKNAVHALRGFTSCLEAKVTDRRDALASLAGLNMAIDHLDELARRVMHPDATVAADPESPAFLSGASAARVLREVAREVMRSFPEIRIVEAGKCKFQSVFVTREILWESLLNLIRNSSEAMNGRGTITWGTRASTGRFFIEIEDQGPGISSDQYRELFNPGHTTKTSGTGLGLFLARRRLREFGGDLLAKPSRNGGARFAIVMRIKGSNADGRSCSPGRR